MTVYRRVVNQNVGNQTVVETLECGHDLTLYRQVRGGRVTWATTRGQATGLSTKSRECEPCTAEAARADEERTRGWRE